jgi:hypothetical protein
MAKGFWVKVKPQADIYGSATWKAVSNVWVKTSPTAWQSVSDMWVKVKPVGDGYGSATWKTLYSAGTAPDSPVEILLDYNSSDLARLQGKNYRWTPTPSTLQYKFSVVNASNGVVSDLTSFTNTTNPSAGNSITLPTSTTYRTVADSEVFPGELNTFQFIVKGTTGSGLTFTYKAENSILIPKAPTITATTLSSTSVRLTITAASSQDYDATIRYIVYLNDGTSNRFAGNTVGITGLGGYGANSDPVEVTIGGLTAGGSYTFYVKPITGFSGSTLTNYSGYGGLTGSLSFQDATPINQVRPDITGTPAPGQTIFVTNGTWTQSPTSYLYQWKRSTDAQSYENIPGATSNSYSIPTNFITSGYNYILCTVTAVKGSSSASMDTFTKQVIAQQLITPILSLGSQGYTVFPKGYATITVNNFYQSYTGAETWSASISPSTGVSFNQNGEFPEEWIFSELNASTTYTVTISVNRSGFTGASQSIQFTSLGANPPTGGSVSVDPTSGTAGSTTYTASASGWSGTGTISYSYSWQYFSSGSFSYVQYTTGTTFSPPSNINSLYPNFGWRVFLTASNGISPNGTASASFTLNTPLAKLSTPTGVNASDNRTDGVLVTWNAVSGASYYGVWYGSAPGYDSNPDFGGPNNPTLITGTSYLDTAISAGSTRDYYVQAFYSNNPAGTKSNWGGPNSGTRTVALPLPSTPTGLSATTNRSTDVFLSWNASANASTYEIWWGGPPSDSSPPDFFPGSSTFYFDNSISEGSSRTYYVRARNSVGASPWSGGVTGTRTAPVVVVPAPSTPTGVSTSGSGLVSWSASSGATSYTVEYYTATNSSGANQTGPYYGSPGNSTSFQISYPTVNSVLQNWARARVLASNSSGSSAYSGFSPASGFA